MKITPELIDEVFDGIELPDEKTLSKQQAAHDQWSDPTFRENRTHAIRIAVGRDIDQRRARLAELMKDPAHRDKIEKGQEKLWSDENYRRAAAERNIARAKDPMWIQAQRDGVLKSSKSAEWIESNKKGIAKRFSDPDQKKMQADRARAAGKANGIPCCTPYGVFGSSVEAAAMERITPSAIRAKIKREVAGYRYITKEEYDLLKEKQNETI